MSARSQNFEITRLRTALVRISNDCADLEREPTADDGERRVYRALRAIAEGALRGEHTLPRARPYMRQRSEGCEP
jgi:hypothetical protein